MPSIARTLLLAGTTAAALTDSYAKWSSVYASGASFESIPSCAQPCLAGVDAFLSCWSAGCVCSEGTPGLNFLNGTRFVAGCARANCPAAEAAGAENAVLSAFQGLCGVAYSSVVVVTTVVAGVSTTVATTVTATVPADATPTFDSSHPVIIDKPSTAYDALDPCVRWVLNVCKGNGDNAANCKPKIRDDYQGTWNGLGAYLRCSNSECVCAIDRFLHSTDKFYYQADYFCNIGLPYQGKLPQDNEAFINTMNMLADYCSSEGNIVAKWLATMYGQLRETGMTTEKIVAIATGAFSCAAAVATVIPALIKLWSK